MFVLSVADLYILGLMAEWEGGSALGQESLSSDQDQELSTLL